VAGEFCESTQKERSLVVVTEGRGGKRALGGVYLYFGISEKKKDLEIDSIRSEETPPPKSKEGGKIVLLSPDGLFKHCGKRKRKESLSPKPTRRIYLVDDGGQRDMFPHAQRGEGEVLGGEKNEIISIKKSPSKWRRKNTLSTSYESV